MTSMIPGAAPMVVSGDAGAIGTTLSGLASVGTVGTSWMPVHCRMAMSLFRTIRSLWMTVLLMKCPAALTRSLLSGLMRNPPEFLGYTVVAVGDQRGIRDHGG